MFFSGGGIFFYHQCLKMFWTCIVTVNGQFLAGLVTEIIPFFSWLCSRDYTSKILLYSTSFFPTIILSHIFKICRFCLDKEEVRWQKVGEEITRKKGESYSNLEVRVAKYREEELPFCLLHSAQGLWGQGVNGRELSCLMSHILNSRMVFLNSASVFYLG